MALQIPDSQGNEHQIPTAKDVDNAFQKKLKDTGTPGEGKNFAKINGKTLLTTGDIEISKFFSSESEAREYSSGHQDVLCFYADSN